MVKSLKENLIFFKMISISHASPETYWIKKAWNQINIYSAMKVMRSFPGGLQTHKD